MRTKQPTRKAAWGAVMVVALVALGCFSTMFSTMFARQTDDPIEEQTAVVEDETTNQGVPIAELGTEVLATDEDEMDADSPVEEAKVDDASDTETEEASAIDSPPDTETEEASAVDSTSDTHAEEASTDDMTDMDTELASAADDNSDTETKGVSPETGNP